MVLLIACAAGMCLQFWHSNDSCLSVKLLINVHIIMQMDGNETVHV